MIFLARIFNEILQRWINSIAIIFNLLHIEGIKVHLGVQIENYWKLA